MVKISAGDAKMMAEIGATNANDAEIAPSGSDKNAERCQDKKLEIGGLIFGIFNNNKMIKINNFHHHNFSQIR